MLNNPATLTDPAGTDPGGPTLAGGCPNTDPAGINAQGETVYTSCNPEEAAQSNQGGPLGHGMGGPFAPGSVFDLQNIPVVGEGWQYGEVSQFAATRWSLPYGAVSASLYYAGWYYGPMVVGNAMDLYVAGGLPGPQQPQSPTQQQKKQACLNEFNSSPDGKFYNFFSLASPFIGPNRLESTVEDTAGITAKYAGYKGLRYVADNDVALPELSPILADSIPWIAKEVVLPISLAATAGQVTGHVGCSIASHF